jgi:uncharacterized repeat protein (TIGR03803 family)
MQWQEHLGANEGLTDSDASYIQLCGGRFKTHKDNPIQYRGEQNMKRSYAIGVLVVLLVLAIQPLAVSQGFLYGTTELAGDLKCGGTPPGCGVVFKLDDGGNETVLHSFKGSDGAGASRGTLLLDTAGSLYGTAADGGTGAGVVFKITP